MTVDYGCDSGKTRFTVQMGSIATFDGCSEDTVGCSGGDAAGPAAGAKEGACSDLQQIASALF